MRRVGFVIGAICLCHVVSSFAASEGPRWGLDAVADTQPYPWAINEPVLIVRLDSDRGYHERDPRGVMRGSTWLSIGKLEKIERSLKELFGTYDIYKFPRGKAVFLYLPGPFTLAYFVSHHQGHPTYVAIEVPGKVDLETLNMVASEKFPDIWKTLDPITEIVKSESFCQVQELSTSVCDKLLSSCTPDDLVCELEKRGWTVNLTPKK